MLTPDAINACFQFGGSAVLMKNVVQLHKDKEVKGVHWVPTLFFASWGMWNLFYYPHLDQRLSFIAGLFLVTVNTIWFLQMVYYKR